MFVCVSRLTLQIPDSGSLKAKRQVLRRVTDRVKARFNVSVAEVDDNDLWQRAVIAIAVVGNDRRHVDEQMAKVIHFVEEMYVAPLIARETEIIGFGERLFVAERPGDVSDKAGVGARAEKDEEASEFEDEEDPGDLSTEDLIAKFTQGASDQRSLAEAEGLGDWERRHGGRGSTEMGKPAPAGGGSLSLDEARARARSLRNPRDWEKK